MYIMRNLIIYGAYSSPKHINVIKSRRMRWEGMGKLRNINILFGRPKGKRTLG
jgi:hypothetical protein